MKYERFDPLARDLSRLVLGSMVFHLDVLPLTFQMLDAWLELGGNVIDTAHLYNSGNSERAIGRWLESRGGRGNVVILTKGAHHNLDRRRVTPEDITCDLRDSLARLGTGYVDLYVLHRDDPEVPVDEIVDVLNEHYEARRILAFGGSNWSPERLDAANDYARRKGLQGFTASSPHLSLAVPRGEVWEGCLDARGPRALAWYAQRQLPLFAWSSQARGFFSGAFTPENVGENEFMARVYDSSENWERLQRAEALGRERGFSAIEVALAWVLHQPFPVFPIIGPASVEELRSSIHALDLELTPTDLAWLSEGTAA
ncbi:MAG: aldo/keto reductase [Armatimonadetes bacterium]|nr:aldo/keto reductase [Armatimonadota bacterium]